MPEKVIRKFSPIGLGVNDLVAILKSVAEDFKGKRLFIRCEAEKIVIYEGDSG